MWRQIDLELPPCLTAIMLQKKGTDNPTWRGSTQHSTLPNCVNVPIPLDAFYHSTVIVSASV